MTSTLKDDFVPPVPPPAPLTSIFDAPLTPEQEQALEAALKAAAPIKVGKESLEQSLNKSPIHGKNTQEAVLALKGFDKAAHPTPEQEKAFEQQDKALFDHEKEHPNEPMKVGKLTLQPEEIKQLTDQTGFRTRSEVYARAEEGIATSKEQISDIEKAVPSILDLSDQKFSDLSKPSKGEDVGIFAPTGKEFSGLSALVPPIATPAVDKKSQTAPHK